MKKLVITSLLVSICMLPILGCQQQHESDKVAQTTNLYAKSFDWYVQLTYQPTSNGYIEIPSIQYLGKSMVTNVDLYINYSNKSFTSNRITKENFTGAGLIELSTRTKISDWRDSKTVKVTWQEGSEKYEEIIKIEQGKPDF